uniref:Uncharacterized protein n=1 Tax=Peronospora matthiolae TaxID=2874970 RepID=A0AAV1T687_9STRA
MTGASLLTQGLESLLQHKSPAAIHEKLRELYRLDDALQAAHLQAKRDHDLGEDVVAKYKAFLACRERLISELKEQQIPMPWQLRTTINDLELTLKQRQKNVLLSTENQDPAQSPQSMQVAVAFIGPTLIALAIAALWYHVNT